LPVRADGGKSFPNSCGSECEIGRAKTADIAILLPKEANGTIAEKGLNAVCAMSETFRVRRSPAEIAEATLKMALKVTGMERAAVVLKNQATGEMEVIHSESIVGEEADAFRLSLTIVGEVMTTNESLLVFDALTTDRPYRPGMSRDKAWTIMENGSGSQFDADFLAGFRELVYSGATERLESVITRFGLTGNIEKPSFL